MKYGHTLEKGSCLPVYILPELSDYFCSCCPDDLQLFYCYHLMIIDLMICAYLQAQSYGEDLLFYGDNYDIGVRWEWRYFLRANPMPSW